MARTSTFIAALVATAALAAPALAQKQHRYDRDKAPDRVDVDGEDVRDLASKRGKQRKKVVDERPLTADDLLEIRTKQAPIRDAQIAEYKLLIEDTDADDDEMPDLLFRLAELQAQRAANLQFQIMEHYNDLDAARGKKAKNRIKKKIKRRKRARRAALDDAIETYERASARRYQNYAGADDLLFYYAHTLSERKKHDRAREVFAQLIADHPGSDHIPDAWAVFGDYYFSRGSLANAEDAYDKVLKFPNAQAYTYALYKKGWVQLNLDRNQDALETFYKVIGLTKNDPTKRRLADSARHDFARAYSHVGKAKLALKTFERIDEPSAFAMLGFLADLYVEHGKANRAIYILREMMVAKPRHREVCNWQYTVAELMLAAGDSFAQKADEIENLVTLYTAYAERTGLPDGYLDDCRTSAATLAGTMARTWHNTGVTTRNVEILDQSARMYEVYLDAFTGEDDFLETEYFYAELLWAAGEMDTADISRWEKAAGAFTRVVKRNKASRPQIKAAAWGAVLSWKNALNISPAPELPDPVSASPDEVPARKKIPANRKKMLEAFRLYIDNVDDATDDVLVELELTTGETYARYNRFSSAVKWFEKILTEHPDHELAMPAAHLLLDSLILSRRYDDMIEWVTELASRSAFMKANEPLRDRVVAIRRMYLRKRVEEVYARAEQTGDLATFVDCGERYHAIYESDKEAADNAEVLYNAGVCFERGKSLGAAVQMFDALQSRYADSPEAQRGLARLGGIYASIAYYDIAIDLLEDYGRKYGGEDDADEALSDAVFYAKGIGDGDRAIRLTNFFVKQYGAKYPDQAASALFNLTAVYEERGDEVALIEHLRRYIDEFGKTGGIDRHIAAYARLGVAQWDRSCPVETVNGACVKVTRERSVARARAGRSGTAQRQCGPETKIKVRVHDRNRRQVKAAQKAFNKAVSLWNNGKAIDALVAGDDRARRKAFVQRHVASAQFHLAESLYERFLALEFPAKLDFDKRNPKKRKKSQKRFNDWLTERTSRGVKANEAYKALIDSTIDAHYAIASAARIGQISQSFAHTLYTAEIPKNVRTGKWAEDKIMSYCEALEDEAMPLEATSLAAFEVCLETSTELSWFNEWSKLCEHELGQMRPEDFPTAAEVHADAIQVAPIIDTEAAVLDLADAPSAARVAAADSNRNNNSNNNSNNNRSNNSKARR